MSNTACDTAEERISRPTREQVRAWLLQRFTSRGPLPDMDQIRHALGWSVEKKAKPE